MFSPGPGPYGAGPWVEGLWDPVQLAYLFQSGESLAAGALLDPLHLKLQLVEGAGLLPELRLLPEELLPLQPQVGDTPGNHWGRGGRGSFKGWSW